MVTSIGGKEGIENVRIFTEDGRISFLPMPPRWGS
jgi:hypothetical protein